MQKANREKEREKRPSFRVKESEDVPLLLFFFPDKEARDEEDNSKREQKLCV